MSQKLRDSLSSMSQFSRQLLLMIVHSGNQLVALQLIVGYI